MSSKLQMRIFGCGGCGINLATPFLNQDVKEGVATPEVALIDTSRSNLTSDHNNAEFFLITDDGEGSGKVRRDNAAVIADNVRQALQMHKPTAFNVVVFSASGGSGSVIGPMLLRELLTQGHPAVAIVVGSDESSITATNTLNTLKSLDAIGKTLDKPMVISYQHNSRENVRSVIDKVCQAQIHTLTALCSGENEELDQRDVQNWLFYNHSTSVPAQLSLLEVCDKEEVAKSIKAPISVASLQSDKDAPAPDLYPEYSAIGYCLGGIQGEYEEMHFVISVDGIKDIIRLREEACEKYSMNTQSRNAATTLATPDEVDTATGLVF